MDVTKLKLKIGDHEFEAEGPAEIVQQQLAAFRELVTTATAAKPHGGNDRREDAGDSSNAGGTQETNGLTLDKIMQHDSRVVSLTVRGGSIEEEILLVLLGQKHFRQNDSVTGSEILDGLRQTRGNVNRVDYQLTRMADEGMVISVGTRRARRYRLTNQGVARAQDLARELIARVA